MTHTYFSHLKFESLHPNTYCNLLLYSYFSGSDSPLTMKPSVLPGHLPPNSYFGSPLGLLHFQQQLQQQALNSSFFQRTPAGAMSLPYQSHLSATSLLGGATGLPPTSMATSPWSPYFLFARQPQPGSNMAGAPNENSTPNGLPAHLRTRGIPPSSGIPPTSSSGLSNNNTHKELILNSSIESLRMRARQHSASLGLYD